ncbi:transglutaminase family protein [Flammeovirgaceae bacterium SG7u.111]|nr:transglutaminase family protein [Flammeovirgaceae bacterium SG7u.132]WPO33978.1 transglutaminase family protein [Flammeovirgaceae bacterium SG7u.111]
MAIRVAIKHKTRYDYDRFINLSPHTFRLRPAVHSRTKIEAYSLNIEPKEHFINWQQDPFGNYQARVVFPEKTKSLSVEVEVIAELAGINPFDFFLDEYAEEFPFKYKDQIKEELTPYLKISEESPLLDKWLEKIDLKTKRRTVDFLVEINQAVNKDIAYSIRMEPGVQTCQVTLEKALGSCRDSSWLLVQIFRHLGLAARFVSGYLVQLTSDQKSLDGPSGPEKDFTDLHAWVEVYIPGAGWIGLDPTSGLFASEGHIPLACTPEPASAAPVEGATDKTEVEFFFDNSVERIHEDPRVTLPFSEAQWEKIYDLGLKVDKDLEDGDVRLTMGGEPTFVSIDDMESAQWNSAADGPHKRALASQLIKKLRNEFGKGGLLHYGQGKWYPGEELPRWNFSCYWRKDGVPIWNDETLLADNATDYKHTPLDALNFMARLAKRLGIPVKNIVPGYEDAFYYAWKEGSLPENIDPLKFNLKDSLERKTIAKVLDRGLDTPTGFVLPLQWNLQDQDWESGKWKFRREDMFLFPGNSPMGLRLPLDSLPWEPKDKKEVRFDQDLFRELPELANFFKESEAEEKKKKSAPVHTVVRTALTIEEREGRVHIFMPPLTHLEHYLDLIAKVELTAKSMKMPVLIEGYEPPKDYRVEKLSVTPDPGVIEVNVHPVTNFKDLVYNTETLYEIARTTRLGTEKFMLDGKHSGTGGGNHVTLGGTSPADSPMLRNPNLLRSLITYWQHHPGLSYLFSGAFIGTTSQAPRVDEGRDEMLYELEIAFSQIPEGEEVPFWLVDRLFRNLLIDITGNTHRAEFCIDKLYSPDSSSGRLGILEMRAFDMPPHARMSVLQVLLIRALIAWFWKTPYKKKLVRWGTELHDRFLLPHYVKQDIADVVDDLKQAGYDFDLKWFDSFFEFRFPHYGTLNLKNIEVELRSAIEPWNVLGEEMSNMGTARFVDSSLERLQVKISGLTDNRYVLTCNGNRVPLKSTGTKGEYISGIRYRAWQPPSALHPTIGVDTPLVFDLVDTWNNRSIGGCTYFVTHPGGRSYEIFPINAFEAEGRRINRFWDYGHTQEPLEVRQDQVETSKGVFVNAPSSTERKVEANKAGQFVDLAAAIQNPEYPYTLDMRLTKSKGK